MGMARSSNASTDLDPYVQRSRRAKAEAAAAGRWHGAGKVENAPEMEAFEATVDG
jgi:hypothetical protein